MDFDPILAAVETTMITEAPTHVDDVACCCFGDRHAAGTQAFFMMAVRVAGLLTEAHSCCGATFLQPTPDVRAAFHRLPAALSDAAAGGIRATTAHELQACLGPLWREARRHAEPCQCSIKSAAVPDCDIDGWADSMRNSHMMMNQAA